MKSKKAPKKAPGKPAARAPKPARPRTAAPARRAAPTPAPTPFAVAPAPAVAPPAEPPPATGATAGHAVAQSIAALSRTLDYLEQNFEDLQAACNDDAQRAALAKALADANENHTNALAGAFEGNEDELSLLNQEIASAHDRITQLTVDQQNIANLLNLLSAAVSTGARVAALFA